MAKEKCCKGGCKNLKHYDYRLRKVIRKGDVVESIKIERRRCRDCGCYTTIYPDDILPYKQYDKDIYEGVVEGFITPDTYGFEEYPSERTMQRWIKEHKDDDMDKSSK